MSGVLLMVIASGFFTAMSASVKALGPGFPATEAVFFRALLSVPVLLVMVLRRQRAMSAQQPGMLLIRCVFGFLAMTCFFLAVQGASLANVMVIARIQPLLVVLLAPLSVSEHLPRSLWPALGLSVTGVILVLQPSTSGFAEAGVLPALFATFLSAIAHLSVRRLGATERPELIVLAFTLFNVFAGGGITWFYGFVKPQLWQWPLLCGAAVGGTGGQLFMTHAYRREKAPIVSLASYSHILYGLCVGYLFWRELPNALALAGASLVTLSGIYLATTQRGNSALVSRSARPRDRTPTTQS